MKNPRTHAELKNDPRVYSIHSEDGSWWCYLVSGLITDHMECGTIHEYTIRGVIVRLRGARPSLPGECGHNPERDAENKEICGRFKTTPNPYR